MGDNTNENGGIIVHENLDDNKSKIEQLAQYIRESKRIVAFTGAGCSTESGVPDFRGSKGLFNEGKKGTNSYGSTESNIPDFRSEDGLYGSKQAKTYPYPPETMLSHSFFKRHTEQFFEYYFDRMVYPQAKPNAAHYALAELEAQGKLSAVVTQNIDGLHQQAGSKRVYELHGGVLRNHCVRCGASYSLEQMLEYKGKGVPRCSCGGVIKPDVVLYEESLDSDVLEGAVRHIMAADLLIVGGTSLAVYPAAGLLQYYGGRELVLINKTETPYDRKASLVIRQPIGKVLSKAVEGL